MGIRTLWSRHEGPTWAVAAAIYAGWGLLTWFYHALPLVFTLPAAAWIVCWHGSLQHEAIHGHPTRHPLVNELLASPALGLFFPYRLYRRSHLRHHNNERLTYPFEDPESYYVSPRAWESMSKWRRRSLLFYNTLLGRLSIGPLFSITALIRDEARRMRHGDFSHGGIWLLHIPAVAVVLLWAWGVCGIPPLAYAVVFAYPGLSLTLLRSFAEHRAAETVSERTVIVKATPWMRLLFLNNNFHSVHHDDPRLAWYKIPARYQADAQRFLNGNGHYYFSSYAAQFHQFFVKPKEMPVHPL